MHISRRVLAVAGTVTVLVGVGTAAGAAIAAGPVSGGVVSACYKTAAASNGSHAVVLEDTGHTCPSGYTHVTWNQKGQTGTPGPRGPAGPGLLAGAYVNANGTVASSSGNVTVANPSPGSYCIGITGGTAHVAVASLDSLENTGGTVQAGVFPASECPANAQNILVVTRPQSQDGGFPGVNHAFYIIVS